MASLTLHPAGDDRSTIRRHLSGLCFLGMTPNGLMICSLFYANAESPSKDELCQWPIREPSQSFVEEWGEAASSERRTWVSPRFLSAHDKEAAREV